jgi:hypothetical protein
MLKTLKTMTSSIAFGAPLLFGTASTALAARMQAQNDPAGHQANGLLITDSVALPNKAPNMACSIVALYHDKPYCFGSEATGRTRIGGSILTMSGY